MAQFKKETMDGNTAAAHVVSILLLHLLTWVNQQMLGQLMEERTYLELQLM